MITITTDRVFFSVLRAAFDCLPILHGTLIVVGVNVISCQARVQEDLS